MILRILASVILLLSILFMPLWVSVILALLGMVYFSFFIEAVLLFLLSDLLYGAPEPKLFNIIFASSVLAFIYFVILELLKNKLRLNIQ